MTCWIVLLLVLCAPPAARAETRPNLLLYHEEWQLDGGREKIATNRAVELYDIASDVGERRDLAAAKPRKRDELLADLLEWIERIGAPLPVERNPAYLPSDKRVRR